MGDESIRLYLTILIGGMYKILPMKENGDTTLAQYIDSYYIQLAGAMENFPSLRCDVKYISVLNVVQFFRTNDFNVKTCKREVLKCVNILSELAKNKEVDE